MMKYTYNKFYRDILYFFIINFANFTRDFFDYKKPHMKKTSCVDYSETLPILVTHVDPKGANPVDFNPRLAVVHVERIA